MLGVKFPPTTIGSTVAARTARFGFLTGLKAFQCPENDVMYGTAASSGTKSGSPFSGTFPMISYCTSTYFQLVYNITSGEPYELYQEWVNTQNYQPKITNVGDAGAKIWLSESARWTSQEATAQAPPAYNLTYNATDYYNAYSDYGPCAVRTDSYLGAQMVLAMRHGSRAVSTGAKYTVSTPTLYETYRMNCAFFDGHVETMDGLKAMNPNYWMPKGTSLPATEVNATAKAKYLNGQSGNYYVPLRPSQSARC